MQIPQERTKPQPVPTSVNRRNEASSPAALATSLVTTDPAEFELALRPWELMCRPRTGGDFRHTLSGIKTADFIIYRERYSLPVDIQGLSPDNALAIAAPIYTAREAQFWSTPYEGSILPSTLPGPLDVKLDAGHYHQILIINLSYLQTALSEEVLDRLVCAIKSRFLTVPPKVLKNYINWGGRLLNMAEKEPSLIEQAAIVGTLQQELLQHLALIAGAATERSRSVRYSLRQQGLLTALDCLRGDFRTIFSMAKMCQVSGISERSLQYAFQETFGMTPYQFMKHRRLHAARQALIKSSQSGVNRVSKVATDFGFYELGRFATDYRQLFGELPSKTLQKSPPLDLASFLNS